jgi:hypothetical protein
LKGSTTQQQQTRPTSHWHSQVKHSGRGWLAGLSPAHHTSRVWTLNPESFFFLRSQGPRLQGAIPLSHLSSFSGFHVLYCLLKFPFKKKLWCFQTPFSPSCFLVLNIFNPCVVGPL